MKKILKSKTSKNLYLLFFFIGFAIKIIDSYKSGNFISNHFFISTNLYIIFTLFIGLVLRVNRVYPFSKRILSLLTLVFTPFFLIFPMLLVVLNVIKGSVNYVYSIFPVQIEQLYIIGLFFFFTSLTFIPHKSFEKNLRSIVFNLPIVISALFYLYGFLPFEARWKLGKEDGLIENMQFAILLISSFISLLIARKLLVAKLKFLGLVFLFITFALVFVSGDEISWGQRILDIKGPEFILDNNTQREITLHNQNRISDIVPIVYALTGFYGSFAFFFGKKLTSNYKNLNLFIPQNYLTSYFFIAFVYNSFLRFENKVINGGEWAELVELILYVGCFLHLYFKNSSLRKAS